MSQLYKIRTSLFACQLVSECGDDRRELNQNVSGQGSDRGRRAAIGESFRQGIVSQWAAIANVHAAEREVSIRALKEDRHPLARRGWKG